MNGRSPTYHVSPATVIRGDARRLPLPDSSVDLIITSPPYWSLRAYTDGGETYAGQIGAEPTWQEYVDNLIDCTREWVRVLKDTGSLFVNLGDKYSSAAGPKTGEKSSALIAGGGGRKWVTTPRGRPVGGIPEKSLMDLPWRYSIRCIDELGLIKRAEILWSKVNGLPESVTDRVRRSHEVFLHLVKQPRYYSAVDEIRQPHARTWDAAKNGRGPSFAGNLDPRNDPATQKGHRGTPSSPNPLGALPGSVWTIPTEPLSVPDHLGVDHFAAFPTEWPRRIILGWSPSGICTECGEGRRPVAAVERVPHYAGGSKGRTPGVNHGRPGTFADERVPRTNPLYRVTGEACACTPYTDHPDVVHDEWVERGQREYHFDRWTPAPTRPTVVLDPFGGSGTTALVARALGRIGISVDRSADYCRLARWRTSDPGQLAKAMRVERPPVQHVGQLDLFGEVAS